MAVDQSTRVAYIAGPMSGMAQHNFPLFDRTAAKYRAMGWTVYNPAEIDRDHGVTEDTPEAELDRRALLKADFDVIFAYCNTMVMLPGWERSRGATAEHALAKAVDDIEVIYEEV